MPQVTQDISNACYIQLAISPNAQHFVAKFRLQKIAGLRGSATPFAEDVHFFLQKTFILTERFWRNSCRCTPVNQVYVERERERSCGLIISFTAQVKYLNCAEPGNQVHNQVHICQKLSFKKIFLTSILFISQGNTQHISHFYLKADKIHELACTKSHFNWQLRLIPKASDHMMSIKK